MLKCRKHFLGVFLAPPWITMSHVARSSQEKIAYFFRTDPGSEGFFPMLHKFTELQAKIVLQPLF